MYNLIDSNCDSIGILDNYCLCYVLGYCYSQPWRIFQFMVQKLLESFLFQPVCLFQKVLYKSNNDLSINHKSHKIHDNSRMQTYQ